MKIRCDRDELNRVVTAAAKVAPDRTPKPILSCLHVEAGERGVEVTATDLETSMRLRVAAADVDARGVGAVNATKLREVVRELGAGTVTLEAIPGQFAVTGVGGSFRITAEDPADFPMIPRAPTDDAVATLRPVPAKLAVALKRALPAIQEGMSKYALGCILLEPEGDGLVVVATDGKRLAINVVPLAAAAPTGWSATLPRRAAEMLVELADATSEDDATGVGLAMSAKQAFATTSAGELVAQVSSLQFPPWRDARPADKVDGGVAVTVEVGTMAFLAGLKRAELFTDKATAGVTFRFAAGTPLRLTSRAAGVGDAEATVAVAYDGPPLEVEFLPRLWMDVLRAAGDQSAKLTLRDRGRPATLQTPDGLELVVMPLQAQYQ